MGKERDQNEVNSSNRIYGVPCCTNKAYFSFSKNLTQMHSLLSM